MVKSPNLFIAEAPSNPLLMLPFNVIYKNKGFCHELLLKETDYYTGTRQNCQMSKNN